MKRASYRDAIDWIAQNEDTGDDLDVVTSIVSVCLIADIFGVERNRAGADVIRRRAKVAKERAKEHKPAREMRPLAEGAKP